MIIRPFGKDGIPGRIMRNYGFISALVEIGAEGGINGGKILIQKALRNKEHYLPATFRSYQRFDHNALAVNIYSSAVMSSHSDAGKSCADGIHFEINIILVGGVGSKEKFHTAINADAAVMLCSGHHERPFVSGNFKGKSIVSVYHGCYRLIR